MSSSTAIRVDNLSHRYGQRQALDRLSLSIAPGEIFAFLGPNGSGKTTLFRILSTLIPPQTGLAEVFGQNVADHPMAVRSAIGVVFQAPSLDRKLTVAENIHHQGRLYGMKASLIRQRAGELLARLGLAQRSGDRVETLSGGLRRRAELAKGMLHRPRLLLLDEPSTGLDPGARSDLWHYLHQERDQSGITVVLTTHLLEEADRADRLAILSDGRLVACDTPDRLRASVGGDAITIRCDEPKSLADDIRQHFGLQTMVLDGSVRLESTAGHELIGPLVDRFGDRVGSITLGKPTLEDVFIDRTGHRFWNSPGEEVAIG
ncbi:MAG: ABC transporter ATP-binding protein [Pirellulales bacterium]